MTRTVRLRPLAEGRPRPVRRVAETRLPRRGDARRRQDDLRAHCGAAPARRAAGAADRRRADRAPEGSVGARRRRVLAAPRPVVVGCRRRACPPTCTGSSPRTSRSRRARRCSGGSRATRSSSSTSCITPPTTGPGAPRSRRRSRDAGRRLALSGTPFRSDTRAIPFVCYHGDEAVPDFEYSYGDALADRRVVRPVYFPTTNGQMEWAAPDGSIHSATFDDRLDTARASQRLRTALSLDGEWLPSVLRSAHARLIEVRPEQPDAGGLVIATDQEHARGIADAAAHALRHECARRHVGRPARLRRHRRLRRGFRSVARRGAHGLGGRRHTAPPGRRLRHDDRDRALLPPGGRTLRPLDARRAAPARVALHPRRPAPAPARRARRRAASAFAAPRP